MNTAVSALPGIRPMLSMDLQRVVDLEMRIYPFPWTIGNFKDSLAAGYSCWVVVESGVIVAYAVVMIGVDEAHLLNLSVAPECQRKGLGSRLMGHLLEVARECEAARVLLEVRESNSAGRHFYATQRFASIGVRRGYYPAQDGREDAIVMELAL